MRGALPRGEGRREEPLLGVEGAPLWGAPWRGRGRGKEELLEGGGAPASLRQ